MSAATARLHTAWWPTGTRTAEETENLQSIRWYMCDRDMSAGRPSRIRGLLTRHGWLAAIAVIYLYVFPYYPRIQSANELPRLYLVTAIVDDHTFAIDNGVKRWGKTSDLAAHDHHYYPNKAPGASLFAVPVYAAARWLFGEPSLATTMWLCRMATGVAPTLALLWLLYGFLQRYAPDPELRRLVVIAYALGSLALPYSLLYYSHQLSAVCIASAWVLALDVADRRRGVIAMAVAGLLAGCAPLVDYQAAFAAIPIAVHAIWRMRRAQFSAAKIGRALLVAGAGAVLPIALLLYYHWACFGSPFATGYNYAVTYGADHDHGLLGMTTPTWNAFFGTMWAPDNGFFALAPWWLLAIPGSVVLWRSDERGTVIVAAAVAAAFIYFISSIGFWRAGWEVGPRYLTAMQPFLLPLVCGALTRVRARPFLVGAASGLIVVAVVIYVSAIATMPYWPDAIRNPLYDVAFRLLTDGAVAPNAGQWGLSGAFSIVPYFGGVALVVGWAIQRAGNLRSVVVALSIGAVVIAGFAWLPRNAAVSQRIYVRTLYPAVMP